MVSVSVDSVALICRIATATLEIKTALASAKKAPIDKVPAPGWVTIKTPTKPRIKADQRWIPTFSFKTAIDSNVVNSGAEKLIAMADPKDSRRKAMSMQVIEPNCDSPRRQCPR